MRVRGIKRGQNIELFEQIQNIPDGTEITVDLEISANNKNIQNKQPLTDEERLAKLNELFGAWKNQPDLIEIYDEIDKERHSYRGRKIDSFDNLDNE
jgi:hypothetical protein